ncbi:MAG TPA: HAD-IA family hydrolase [Baekduia sp.]|nr:HAD-IA family hydrolase [Baekduia sp.]
MIDTILFDALGTLVELQDPAPLLVGELNARGVKITEAQARTAVAAEISYYRQHILEGGTAEGLADLRERCTAVLAVELPPHARIAGLQKAMLAAIRFKPYPEVVGTLGVLRARGHKLVVVSNWDISLYDVLDETGISKMIDGVVVSAQRGLAKPNSLLFGAGLAQVRGKADRALHVGDDLEADVRGAIGAGIQPVWLDRSNEGVRPDGVPRISDLRGLLELAP